MGWASGSYLADEMWRKLAPMIPASLHQKAARLIVEKFEEHDADDWHAETNGVWWASRTVKERTAYLSGD